MSEATPEISAAPVENVENSEVVSTGNDEGKGVELNEEGVESFDSWLAKQKDDVKAGKIEPKKEVDLLKKVGEKEQVEAEKDPLSELAEAPKVEEKAPEIKAEELPEFKELSTAHTQLKEQHDSLTAQVKDLVETLNSNPGAVLDHLNVPRDLIEQWYFEKFVKPETMTAEEKLAQYQEREAKQKEEAARAEQERAEQQRIEANRQHWAQKIDEGIKAAGLPKSDFTVSRVAAHLKAGLDKGLQLSVADVIPAVQAEIGQLQQQPLKDLPVEKLIEVLGEEALQKIRSHEVNKLRQASKFEEGKKAAAPVKRTEKAGKKKFSNPYQLLDDL